MPDLVDTYIENRWIVQPNHANTLGSAHGGTILKWMDEVGALSAMRFSDSNCTTARMDQVNFTRPVEVGETALIEAYVYRAGTTSVSVRLRAYAENPRTGDTEPTTESNSVYVAIDEAGTPQEVPDLDVASDRGRKLRQRAIDAETDD